MANSLAKAKEKQQVQITKKAHERKAPSTLGRLLSGKWGLRLIVYGALLVGWQVTAMVKGPFFAPTIPETLAGIADAWANGYYSILFDSLRQMIVGFLLSLVIAIPLGALIGRSRVMDDLLSPYVNTLFVTSKEALIPLFVILFGIGFQYRVAVVVLFAFFFPVMNTAAGVRFVDQHLIETARAFCTSRWRMFKAIYLPGAAPFIVAGIRLGLGMALKGFVIAEIWVITGTGRLLVEAGSLRLLDTYFAIALVIAAIGIGTNEGLKALERRLRQHAHLGNEG